MRKSSQVTYPTLRGFFAYVNNDKWNWAFVVLAVLVLALVFSALGGLLWDRATFQWFWTFTEPVTGIAVLVGVFLGWMVSVFNGMERETEIEIVLKRQGSNDTLKLPYRPLRSQLSRAELQGILALYYGEARYKPGDLRKILEPQGESESMLNAVLRGARDDLEIEVGEDIFKPIQGLLCKSSPQGGDDACEGLT